MSKLKFITHAGLDLLTVFLFRFMQQHVIAQPWLKPLVGKIWEDGTEPLLHRIKSKRTEDLWHWCMTVPRFHPERDMKQRCFILTQQHDKVKWRRRAAVSNLLLHTGGFKVIIRMRGCALGLHKGNNTLWLMTEWEYFTVRNRKTQWYKVHYILEVLSVC